MVSRPTWRVYDVRSCSWSSDAEHDLDLLDPAAVAREHVVDARAHEPAAELRERPPEVGVVAEVGDPLLEHDLVRAELLEARHRRAGHGSPRRISVVAVNSAWPPATTPSDGTSSSTSDASAPSPSSTIVRAWIARPGRPHRPAHDDRLRRARRPRARARPTPWLHAARLSCASLSSAARPVVPAIRRRAVSGSRRTSAVERLHGDAGPARGVGEDDRGLPVLLERGQGGEPVGGAGGRRGGGRGRRVGRDDVPEHGGAQVHVRRVQAVRLDRQRLVRERGRGGARRRASRARRRRSRSTRAASSR